MAERWSDHEMLRALELFETETALEAARILSREIGRPVSRGAVIGIVNRASGAGLPCRCVRPENRDGGMGRGWWRAGIDRRAGHE